jgi:hypothetical protein
MIPGMQKPSVGQVVHVSVNPAENNGQDYAPGVITRVWSDEMINVSVLLDSPSGPIQKTSVKLSEDRPEGAGHVAWWPPRV